MGLSERSASFVDLATMLDREHENGHGLILDPADSPPVPNTIPPELSKLGAFQRGTDASRIILTFYSLVKKSQHPCGYLSIKLF